MSDLSRIRLLLVGCGKMGGAMLRGWLARGLQAGNAVVVEPAAAAMGDIAGMGIVHVPAPAAIAKGFAPDVLVLAVKPQFMDEAIDHYARFVRPEMLVLSIAAGKTLAYFRQHLSASASIVRAMPNTPAAIGRGISAAVADKPVTRAQRDLADTLLSACGEVAWVAEEDLINPVTALSGGGPAYVFLLMEAMAEAGRKAGLPADLAMRLARVTVSGAGELARLSEESAAQLRQNVTSPKGTTLEALKVLMADDGIQPLFDRAIAAATRRSRELAG